MSIVASDLPPMVVSVLHLHPGSRPAAAEQRDLCALHRRVIDATVGMPTDGQPRLLWAQPAPGVLVVRAPEPVTAARLPAGYTTRITHRPWLPPPAGPVTAVLVVNPVTRRYSRDPQPPGAPPNTPRRRNAVAVPITDPAEQAAWLAGRLEPMLRITACEVTWTRSRTGRHHTGGRITHQLARVRLAGVVVDQPALCAVALKGVGRAAAYGAGLSLWTPA